MTRKRKLRDVESRMSAILALLAATSVFLATLTILGLLVAHGPKPPLASLLAICLVGESIARNRGGPGR
jgi:predicted PurR-regulated permease PerM